MVTVSADPENQPTVFTMGLGSVVVGSVIHEDMPGIYFCPAVRPGMVDSDATGEVEGKTVPGEAVVIRFASMDAVLAHLERIQSMMRTFEAELAKRPPRSPA